jgi:broad specificity phosphatase PhoE
MRIYFARHGESEANVQQIYSNSANDTYPLTPKGIQQANDLAITLKDIVFEKIYSSPILRAKQTAEIIARSKQMKVELEAALMEYNVGIFEETPKDHAEKEKEYIANEVAWFFHNNFDVKIEGGESYNDFKKRFVPFIEQLIEMYGNKNVNILLVGHGAIYKAMLPVIFDNISLEVSYNHHMSKCHYVIGELQNGRLHCIEWENVI